MRLIIRTGGQSGVDRAALDVAIAKGIPYAGWCPRGGWAEDFTTPPGLMARYPLLIETPSPEPEQRSAWNVRDSHASLVVVRETSSDASKGTMFGMLCAQLVFMRPCHVATLDSPGAADETAAWLARVSATIDADSLVLNIGGPRESESPGIYAAAVALLSVIIGR